MIRSRLAIIAYQAMTILALPLILLMFCLRSVNHSAYRKRLNERLGFVPKQGSGGLIIHGASLGEIVALSPLVERLLEALPGSAITLTTFTPTGSSQVSRAFSERVNHCYLPVDSPPCVSIFLKRLQPKVLVLMETELWPNLISACRRKGIKVILINARISQRSFPRYQKISALIQPTLAGIQSILAQSPADADRLILMGADRSRVEVHGNLKYDITAPRNILERSENLKLALKGRKIWVVGSSHADEETLIFDAYLRIRKAYPKSLLILAPRHPERYAAVRDRANRASLTYKSRSESTTAPSEDEAIWLIDTMGELLLFYSIADVCTIAGSFGSTGGHNPLEAALFSKPIIVGPNTKNFDEATRLLSTAKGLIQLEHADAESLAKSVGDIFGSDRLADRLGHHAHQVLQKNRGATTATLRKIEALLHSATKA